MRFRKLGLVYHPDGSLGWNRTFAIAPTPVLWGSGLRVYFASCDENLIGRISYLELDPKDPTKVVYVKNQPVLREGDPGCFDDNGVNVTSVVAVGSELWLYYFGYQLHQRTRYSLFAGLAVSIDGGECFERVSHTPILERSDGERFVRSAPFVLKTDSGFRIWYVSGNEWIRVNGKELPRYGLRCADSVDGVRWPAQGREIIAPEGDDEHGFGRPFIVRAADGYRLWYSLRTRTRGYGLGMAISTDGVNWKRDDRQADLTVSETGWDSEMICYASEVSISGKTYLFYNGNGYGRSGFGVAVREA